MTRLRQVLVNLIGNAVKFTEKGEVIVTVSAEPSTEGRVELHFAVADTGIGIPREALEGIFESFRQADTSTTRKYGGTGLGLAISKQLCLLMGGDIRVESEVSVGTTFRATITAPLALGAASPGEAAPSSSFVGKRLLVVDDNATNRRIVALQLEPLGIVVVEASSGAEALAILATRGEAFDAVLLDVQMPGMDGLAVAAEIRKTSSPEDLPIVILSSSAHDDSAAHPELGMACVLLKPVRRSRLVSAIALVVDAKGPTTLPRHVSFPFDPLVAERRPLRILLAEDNVVNQRVALAMLSRFGYRADVAVNGHEVLAAVSRKPYDVILMDLRMPEMDGLEAARRVRLLPLGKEPRIIAMTANVSPSDRDACVAAGMDDFVGKPIRVAELAAALERVESKERPSRPSRPTLPTLDPRMVESLRELEIWEEISQAFMAELPERLQALRDAIGCKSYTDVEHVAHAAKGGSGAIGAARMSSMFARIEEMAEASALAGADETRRVDRGGERGARARDRGNDGETRLRGVERRIAAFVGDASSMNVEYAEVPGR